MMGEPNQIAPTLAEGRRLSVEDAHRAISTAPGQPASRGDMLDPEIGWAGSRLPDVSESEEARRCRSPSTT